MQRVDKLFRRYLTLKGFTGEITFDMSIRTKVTSSREADEHARNKDGIEFDGDDKSGVMCVSCLVEAILHHSVPAFVPGSRGGRALPLMDNATSS